MNSVIIVSVAVHVFGKTSRNNTTRVVKIMLIYKTHTLRALLEQYIRHQLNYLNTI